MTDPWADVRERIERMKEAEARGANLAPIDFASRDLLDDADALLAVVRKMEPKVRLLAVESVRVNREARNLSDKLHALLAEIQQEVIAALPEHSK